VSRVGESLTVVVLAGGRSRRMSGIDKVALSVNGSTILDRALAPWPAEAELIVVGPHRTTSRPVKWCRESPPGGGPLPALSAGVAIANGDLVALVGGDMPLIGSGVPSLLDAARRAVRIGRDGAWLVTPDSRPQPLASCVAIGALRTALPNDPTDRSLISLFRHLDLQEVPVPSEWVLDADTEQDLSRIEHALTDNEGQTDD